MVCPYKLVQLHIWRDFLEEKRAVFDKLCKVFPSDFHGFPRLITGIENGKMNHDRSHRQWCWLQKGTEINNYSKRVRKCSTRMSRSRNRTRERSPQPFSKFLRIASAHCYPGAATSSTQLQKSVSILKSKPWKEHFKFYADVFYVCTRLGDGQGRNVLLFPYEAKPLYIIHFDPHG
ncbi:hypothetical protein E4U45_004657 [Claviceps purpurea]|nr:hypothetical protein E4U45_004657 [Claviceps purpurea]